MCLSLRQHLLSRRPDHRTELHRRLPWHWTQDPCASCLTCKEWKTQHLPAIHLLVFALCLSPCPPVELSLALWIETPAPPSFPPFTVLPSAGSAGEDSRSACLPVEQAGLQSKPIALALTGWPGGGLALGRPALAFVCQRASWFCCRVHDLPSEAPLCPQSHLAGSLFGIQEKLGRFRGGCGINCDTDQILTQKATFAM